MIWKPRKILFRCKECGDQWWESFAWGSQCKKCLGWGAPATDDSGNFMDEESYLWKGSPNLWVKEEGEFRWSIETK